jgi:hypothetical protein
LRLFLKQVICSFSAISSLPPWDNVVTGLVTINDNVPLPNASADLFLEGLGSFDMGPCKGRGFSVLSVLWVKPDVSFVQEASWLGRLFLLFLMGEP